MAARKLLIVDDDKAHLLHLQQILHDAGYLTSSASNGEEAITKVRAEMPDAIFMDINMPVTNGFEAARVLKADVATKNIPVIFVTSKNQKADKLWATMQGAHGFISKPYSNEDILAELKRL
jgi:twitching motility two-component system response regulator PilH